MILSVVVTGSGAVVRAAEGQGPRDPHEANWSTARGAAPTNVDLMLEIFDAVERRDDRRLGELSQPDARFYWPPSLPAWSVTWRPLQPSEAERRMDPRVMAASEDAVVVLWRQRGVSPTGDRFDGEVLGLYQFRDGKLARAQMFFFDTAAAVDFLMKALSPEQLEQGRALRAAYDRFNTLPDDRLVLVRSAYEELRAIPPNQRHHTLDSGGFRGRFSEGERDLLREVLTLAGGSIGDKAEPADSPRKP